VVTENWKFEVHKRDSFTCRICGAEEDPKHPTFQVHHVVFKCNGGSNNLSNLVLLCPECPESFTTPVQQVTTERTRAEREEDSW